MCEVLNHLVRFYRDFYHYYYKSCKVTQFSYNHGQISLGHSHLFQSNAHSSDFRCLPPLPHSTFFGLQMPPLSPPPPPLNVGHKLVHFQPCALFSFYLPQATLDGGGGGWGVQKNPEYVMKSDLKDKMLYCSNEFVHDCRLQSVYS